ncbi:hypothetical protein [Neobacillus sp. D3-1R]|uniref:hypothetical protein n=1 Tax=Neobacillus sp. D3-1R TaxID=3445778 RepID=UPI003F9F9A93
MSPKLLFYSLLSVSWLTTFIIGKKNVRRYTPVSIFASLLVTLVYVSAYHLGWWKLKKPVIPWLKSIDISFIYGPFLVGTIGVFSLSYRFGFRIYMLANILLDSFFSFVFLPFLEKWGIVKLKKVQHFGICGLMLAVAIIIYPFQKWLDGQQKDIEKTVEENKK